MIQTIIVVPLDFKIDAMRIVTHIKMAEKLQFIATRIKSQTYYDTTWKNLS